MMRNFHASISNRRRRNSSSARAGLRVRQKAIPHTKSQSLKTTVQRVRCSHNFDRDRVEVPRWCVCPYCRGVAFQAYHLTLFPVLTTVSRLSSCQPRKKPNKARMISPPLAFCRRCRVYFHDFFPVSTPPVSGGVISFAVGVIVTLATR